MNSSFLASWSSARVEELRIALLRWYQVSGRDLPWRRRIDVYQVWISEIMLQQTQVKTVIPYYERWLKCFPTLESLAEAELDQVLKQWEGLGYYSRSRHLWYSAQKIVTEFAGKFPETLEEILSLPGIGRTTAGGILSLAFNQPVSILEGNVKRVLARLIALDVPPNQVLPQLWQLSDELLDPVNPRDFNQALMDLGATLCTPKSPNCLQCPWINYCRSYSLQKQMDIPVKETPAPLPLKRIGVAVIYNDQGQILIDKRPQSGLLGGLWEFPGGKIEPEETVKDCIKREIKEELDIEIEVGEELMIIDHAYTHFKVKLYVHRCYYLSGQPKPIACDEIRWVTVEEIGQFAFPKANKVIIEALQSNQAQLSLF